MDRLNGLADQIRQRYLVDLIGLVDLSFELRTSINTLRKWMVINEVPLRNYVEARAIRNQAFLNSIHNSREEILRLRTVEGMKILAIADKLDISPKAVGRVLVEADLSIPLHRRQKAAPEPKPLRGLARLYSMRPQVEAALAEGLTGRQLAERFRVSENSVSSWLKETGLKISRTTAMQRRIIEMWKTTDMNMAAIADALSCSRTNVGAVLRHAGLVDKPKALGRPPGSVKGKRLSLPALQQHGMA